jgi:L-threonylcarbamoyladenylate synthase
MRATIGTDPILAANLLAEGKLVALPTETVYGLGGNAFDEGAVAGIFQAKERPRFDPLILHQYTAERVLELAAEVPAAARQLADALWPGPLTLVLPRTSVIPDLVTAGLDTVALRVPAHPLTRKVLRQLHFPVAAPSANPFGFVSPVTAAHVAAQLGDSIDYILDGGDCRIGLESTIVGFPDGRPTVYRKGGTSVERIEEILAYRVEVRTDSSSRPAAPGMLSSHYSPGVPLRIVDRVVRAGTAERAAVIFGRPGGGHTYSLSERGDLEEAARRLFTILRQLAAGGYGAADVERVPERGLGRAINDRLRRAAV